MYCMNKIIVFSIAMLVVSYSIAQKTNYAVSAISPELILNANVVKRFDHTVITIHNPGRATVKQRYALTILNEAGDDYAEFYAGYNKLVKLNEAEGRLYNAAGKEAKSVKKKAMSDLSATGENFMDDNRVKTHNFYCKIYPYTIEYETEKEYKGILGLNTWCPQQDFEFSVESSKMELSCPLAYELRYMAFLYKDEPVIIQNTSTKTYTWEIKNLPAIEEEFNPPSWNSITTTVYLAPSEFEMEDYEGRMDNWLNFGKFIFALNKGRDQLPEQLKIKVHELTDKLKDETQKIEVLYNFLQHSTHYISVQLGIGGWQPFSSEYVAGKGYGDCKALSNFMYAMLKEAGITSYYSLVYAGVNSEKTIENFPSAKFNHVILCIPQAKDTTWLECTSQTVPAGYMGSFTGNRKALLVDANGGKLVSTPRYTAADNLQVRKINGEIKADGNLSFESNTVFSCEQQDDLHSLTTGLSKDKLMDYLKKQIDLATYNVKQSDYKQTRSFHPSIREFLSIDAPNYAATMGKRLFVAPNIMNRFSKKGDHLHKRRFDIDIKLSYTDIDSVILNIPAGYSLEALPEEVHLRTKFGRYDCVTSVRDNKIEYIRRFEQVGAIFPASDYDDLCAFYKTIYLADRKKLVFLK